ncbi:putative cation/H+ exchanger, cation/H+ exchanger, CPA1 family [Helianthus debilis subsp. tardiflorus]
MLDLGLDNYTSSNSGSSLGSGSSKLGSWIKIPTWCDSTSVSQILEYVQDQVGSKRWKKMTHLVTLGSLWRLWLTRNEKEFNGNMVSVQKIVELIKEETFIWVKSTASGAVMDWNSCPRNSFGASAVLFGLIMVGRACFVFPISIISNLTTKPTDNKIEFKHQITVWWAGLMRGAFSVALAYKKGLMNNIWGQQMHWIQLFFLV